MTPEHPEDGKKKDPQRSASGRIGRLPAACRRGRRARVRRRRRLALRHLSPVRGHRRVRRLRPGAVRYLSGDEVTGPGGRGIIRKPFVAPLLLVAAILACATVAAFVGQPVWAAAAGAGLALVYWALEALTWRSRPRPFRTSPSASTLGGMPPCAGRRPRLPRPHRRVRAARLPGGRSLVPRRLHPLHHRAAPSRIPACRQRRDRPGRGEAQTALWIFGRSRRPGFPRRLRCPQAPGQSQEFEVAEEFNRDVLIKLPTIGPSTCPSPRRSSTFGSRSPSSSSSPSSSPAR